MNALRLLIASALFSAAPAVLAQAQTSAVEGCTTDVIARKAQELGDRVNEISKSDPKRAAELNEEIRQMDIKRTQRTLGNECEAYDQRIRDIEKAERQADIPVSEDNQVER